MSGQRSLRQHLPLIPLDLLGIAWLHGAPLSYGKLLSTPLFYIKMGHSYIVLAAYDQVAERNMIKIESLAKASF